MAVRGAIVPETMGWFLLTTTGGLVGLDSDDVDDGQAQGEVGGSVGVVGADQAPAAAFFMHLSQEYFLVAELGWNLQLNTPTVQRRGLYLSTAHAQRTPQAARIPTA